VKVAIPVLHDVMKELGKGLQSSPEVLIALYQLDPAGQELAENWLRRQEVAHHQIMEFRLKARTMLVGAMGRTSFETDWVTQRFLERMDSSLGSVPLNHGTIKTSRAYPTTPLRMLAPTGRGHLPGKTSFPVRTIE
jgi:hypothetical protein